MLKIVNFLDEIYHTMNISQTFILKHNYNNLLSLKNDLEDKDYPVCILNNENDYNEMSYRVFITNEDIFEKVFNINKNIVIISLDEKFNKKLNTVEKIFIFSQIK